MLGKYAETAIDWLSCTAGSARQHTQNFAVHAWHVIVHLLLVPEVVCLLLRCSCGSLCCMELLTQIADLGGKPASLPFMWACMSLLCTSSITPHGEDVCLVLKSGQTIISITNSITVLITEQQVYRSMLWRFAIQVKTAIRVAQKVWKIPNIFSVIAAGIWLLDDGKCTLWASCSPTESSCFRTAAPIELLSDLEAMSAVAGACARGCCKVASTWDIRLSIR